MGIIGGLIGGVANMFGGMRAAKAMRNAQKMVKDRQARDNDWFNRAYNEDATQRADALAAIEKTREAAREASRNAAGMAAVGGATEESLAAQKAANARMMADTMSSITAAADRRKDAIESDHMARQDGYAEQLEAYETNRAQQIAGAVGGLGQAAAGLPW